ncbi:carbohydrate kinase family protein [Lacisediminihabitans profunda]|uniref:carbohydrate kinase family protein n=1 Tax=Lacisediminihabitans profunda TaxID=2594790 RepID=UPI00164FB2FE|nr:PfkB family carbohydrate kinase [Lacisediminihabitans profunda]
MPERRRIVVFGDVIDDVVVVPRGPIRADTDTASSIRRRAGGSAANTAAWLGRLGAAVDFVGMVGVDDLERHRELLARSGVTPHLTGHPDLPTGSIVVIVDGEQRTMLTETGANAAMTPDAVADDLLDAAAIVHFTGYSLFGRPDDTALRSLIARAKARGVLVSVDPGSAGFLADFGAQRFLSAVAGADVLFPSLDEGRALTGLATPEEIVARLAEDFAVVVLTLGTDGVLVAQNPGENMVTEPIRIDAIDTEIVDPTGAGDAFAAGFLDQWVRTGDAAGAARAGVLAGARAVATIGGRPA